MAVCGVDSLFIVVCCNLATFFLYCRACMEACLFGQHAGCRFLDIKSVNVLSRRFFFFLIE